MTLCIGGPLNGRQAPLEHEDTPSFRYERWPHVSIVEGPPVALPRDAAVEHALYRRQPVDIFSCGTSLPFTVYAEHNMTGRDIARALIGLLARIGSHA